MVKLWIPHVGDTIKLAEDWNFDLYSDYQNESLASSMGCCDKTQPYNSRWVDNLPYYSITLPKGTVLRISRYSIKKNQKETDFITFIIDKKTCPYHGRFWARLTQVNELIIEDPTEIINSV